MTQFPHRFVTVSLLVASTFLAAETARAQAFQNLNFELVELSNDLPGSPAYPTAVSVPGWSFSQGPPLTMHIGGNPQLFVMTDLGGGAPSFNQPLEGHFSLYMADGQNFPDPTFIGPYIEQTGLVPAGSQSLRFLESPFTFTGHPWKVSLNGVQLPTLRLADGLISANVTGHAGTVSTLRIAIDPDFNMQPPGPATPGILDAIRFSPLPYTQVPEPTSAVLATLASAFALAKRRRRNSASIG